ncbi:MAG: hypothetical protein GX193_09605 [Clostridiales bacterium]|nr:hypothetical protein [Clostridiales bacterium]
MALDGTWKVTARSLMKKYDGVVVLRTQGEKVTGTVTVEGNTVEIRDGRVRGNEFEIKAEVNILGRSTVTVKGNFDENTMSGTMKMGIMSMKFEGTKTG